MFPTAHGKQGLKMVGQIITPKVFKTKKGGIEMAHQENNTAILSVLEEIIENGMDGPESAIGILVNETMKIERSRVLDAEPWQRNDQRRGYANGYKARSLKQRLRSERTMKLAIAEMYVQGVSTRKVTKVLETLCGLEVTNTEVSRCAALLDEQLEQWRTRENCLARCFPSTKIYLYLKG